MIQIPLIQPVEGRETIEAQDIKITSPKKGFINIHIYNRYLESFYNEDLALNDQREVLFDKMLIIPSIKVSFLEIEYSEDIDHYYVDVVYENGRTSLVCESREKAVALSQDLAKYIWE